MMTDPRFQENAATLNYTHPAYRFSYDTDEGRFLVEHTPDAALHGAVSRAEFVTSNPEALDTAAPCKRSWNFQTEQGADLLTVDSDFASGYSISQQFRFFPDRDALHLRCVLTNRDAGAEPLIISLKPLHLEHGADLRLGSSLLNWSVYNLGFQSWTPAGAVPVGELQQRPLFKVPRVMSYNPARHPPRNRGRHLCDWCAAVKNVNSGQSLVAGFITMKDMMSHLYLRVDLRDRRLLRFNAHCDADRVPLAQGASLASEWLYVCFSGDPLATLDDYADTVARTMHARVASPIPVGWCSWYKYFSRITQNDIHSNLEHLQRLARDIPITWFQLDDGYQKAVGDWTTRIKDKFPDTLDALAGRITSHGFRPGIWTAPFFARTNSRLYAEHPDWFLKDTHGKPAWAGWNPVWSGDVAALDLTHPETQRWLHDTFHTIVHTWGFQFLKIDFLYSAVVKARRHDPSMTRAQAYRRGLDIIREAAGDDVIILGCGAPLGPSVGVADVMRISADTGPKWRDTLVRKAVGGRSEPSVESALVNCVTRSFLHNKFWTSDPDCIMLRKGNLTRDEYRTFATVVGLTGGMVLISDDMSELDDEGRRVFSMLVPPSGVPAVPTDLFERERPSLYTARFPGAPHRVLCAAINWKDTAARLTVDFAALGLDPDASWHVFDFWSRRFLGSLNTDITFTRVPAHGCRFLAITPDTGKPAVLATDLHITAGGMEIKKQTYSKKDRKLSVELKLPGRRSGCVFVCAPEGLPAATLDNVREGTATLKKISPSVYCISVEFQDAMTLSLSFK